MAFMKKPWNRTPLIESAALSKAAGCRIFLKLENLQPSGSFKSRGIGNFLLRHISDPAPNTSPKPIHFYCSSGGNAGLACVIAARSLSYPCTIVVPLTTTPLMLTKIRAAGATSVVQEGASWIEADTYMRETVMPEAEKRGENVAYVHPFDHPDVWEGYNSMVDEIKDDLGKIALEEENGKIEPNAMICSVGGGGLFAGLMGGLDRHNWKDILVAALETHGTDSLNQALKRGELKAPTLPAITSKATSLGARTVCQQAFEYGQQQNVKSVVLEDKEAAMGCSRLADEERLMVELACGVNVAMCYDGRLEKYLGRKTRKDDKVVVIVCGGSNVTVEDLASFRHESSGIGESMSQDATNPSTASSSNGMYS